MEKIKQCAVCYKDIKTKENHFGSALTHSKQFCSSKEGVFFSIGNSYRTGKWFCNDCWKKIIEYVNEKRS